MGRSSGRAGEQRAGRWAGGDAGGKGVKPIEARGGGRQKKSSGGAKVVGRAGKATARGRKRGGVGAVGRRGKRRGRRGHRGWEGRQASSLTARQSKGAVWQVRGK